MKNPKSFWFNSTAAPPPPVFNYSDYGSLWAWQKKGTGITLSSGKISEWLDNSGNSRHIEQTDPAKQPSGDTTASITDDKFLTFGVQTSPDSYTILMLVNVNNVGGLIKMAGSGYFSMDMFVAFGFDRDLAFVASDSSASQLVVNTGINTVPVGEYSVLACRYEQGDNFASLFVNGEKKISVTPFVTIPVPITQELQLKGGNYELVENVIYSTAVSDSNIQAISNHMLGIVAKEELGDIIVTDFTNSTEYTNNFTETSVVSGAGFTVTPSGLLLSATDGSAIVTNFNEGTCLENWEMYGSFNVGAIGFSTNRIFFVITQGTFLIFYSALELSVGSDFGKVLHYGGSGKKSTNALSVSDNDTITFSIKRQGELYTSTYYNGVNEIQFSSVSLYDNLNGSNLNAPTGKFGIYNNGNNGLITEFGIRSSAAKNALFAFIGDSIESGYIQGTRGLRWINKAIFNPNNFVVLAGAGDTSAALLTRVAEIIALNPQTAIITIGTNDVNNSVLTATTVANVDALVTALETAGITVKICEILPLNGGDIATLNAAYVTEFGSRVSIDFYTDFLEPSTTNINPAYSADGGHPNQVGAIAMADKFNSSI